MLSGLATIIWSAKTLQTLIASNTVAKNLQPFRCQTSWKPLINISQSRAASFHLHPLTARFKSGTHPTRTFLSGVCVQQIGGAFKLQTESLDNWSYTSRCPCLSSHATVKFPKQLKVVPRRTDERPESSLRRITVTHLLLNWLFNMNTSKNRRSCVISF